MSLGTQLKKGILEICILSVIGKESIYGYDLIEKIQEVGLVLTEGTLYPILSRLRQDGLVTSTIQESATGPSRRYYKLSSKGEAVLQNGIQEFQEFTASVNKLLSIKHV
jgi:PadR family transcriptional regulator PadR